MSSIEHTADHPREAGKKRTVVWEVKRQGSILQETHCQSSARGGKSVERRTKEEAMTCGEFPLQRRASTFGLGRGMSKCFVLAE